MQRNNRRNNDGRGGFGRGDKGAGRADSVRAKKALGQHFLKSQDIARVIARCVHPQYVPRLMPDGSLDRLAAGALTHDASEFRPKDEARSGVPPLAAGMELPATGKSELSGDMPLPGTCRMADSGLSASPASALPVKPVHVLEIGPGMGVLSACLWEDPMLDVKLVELDPESVVYLASHYPDKTRDGKLIPADFLKMDLREVFGGESFVLTGNFPYNISSQILFRVLEYKDLVPVMGGMFQKEVGERVCARPGSKAYGIMSVLLQAFYRTEYLFTVEAEEFLPPPKVRSCVIRLIRNDSSALGCDEKLFVYLVKKAFNQRRKTLRNAFKGIEEEKGLSTRDFPAAMLEKRAEQLGVEDYVALVNLLQAGR